MDAKKLLIRISISFQLLWCVIKKIHHTVMGHFDRSIIFVWKSRSAGWPMYHYRKPYISEHMLHLNMTKEEVTLQPHNYCTSCLRYRSIHSNCWPTGGPWLECQICISAVTTRVRILQCKQNYLYLSEIRPQRCHNTLPLWAGWELYSLTITEDLM